MFNITKDMYKNISLILSFLIKIHLFEKVVVTFYSSVMCHVSVNYTVNLKVTNTFMHK